MALSYEDATFDYILTSDTLEHVPDFDVALSEIRRVLKPGGKHVFTVPIIWDRRTRRRAEVVDGAVVHHFPPSHHGGPDSSPDDYLVFNEFGGDVVERIENAGFSVALVREPENELVVTIVATKACD
jgi:SAM-dependent methyltransferase